MCLTVPGREHSIRQQHIHAVLRWRHSDKLGRWAKAVRLAKTCMEHELNFTVTKDLMTTATRRFWLQFVGWGGLIRWAVASVALLAGSVAGRQVWLYGVVALLIVFIPLIWVFGYFSFLRRAFYRYGQMQSKLISYRFTEAGLGSKSDLGSADIPWRMLEKVQRYPDVWLLFVGRRDYAYFPVSAMPDGLGAYILQQAEEHGIKTA